MTWRETSHVKRTRCHGAIGLDHSTEGQAHLTLRLSHYDQSLRWMTWKPRISRRLGGLLVLKGIHSQHRTGLSMIEEAFQGSFRIRHVCRWTMLHHCHQCPVRTKSTVVTPIDMATPSILARWRTRAHGFRSRHLLTSQKRHLHHHLTRHDRATLMMTRRMNLAIQRTRYSSHPNILQDLQPMATLSNPSMRLTTSHHRCRAILPNLWMSLTKEERGSRDILVGRHRPVHGELGDCPPVGH